MRKMYIHIYVCCTYIHRYVNVGPEYRAAYMVDVALGQAVGVLEQLHVLEHGLHMHACNVYIRMYAKVYACVYTILSYRCILHTMKQVRACACAVMRIHSNSEFCLECQKLCV